MTPLPPCDHDECSKMKCTCPPNGPHDEACPVCVRINDTPETDSFIGIAFGNSPIARGSLELIKHARKLERERDQLKAQLAKCESAVNLHIDLEAGYRKVNNQLREQLTAANVLIEQQKIIADRVRFQRTAAQKCVEEAAKQIAHEGWPWASEAIKCDCDYCKSKAAYDEVMKGVSP